jgi:magnesium chelatase family protein
LFLDELPEFGMRVLETMRQPIEDKEVTISRAQGALTFPANFQLIGALNPCPCGHLGSPVRECTCSHGSVTRYQKRLSGPLLDRIDIHVDVPFVDYEKLGEERLGEPSESIQARVEAARQKQIQRLSGDGLLCNSDMGVEQIRKYCSLDATSKTVLESAMRQLHLSARGYHRVLKLSRTIADLSGEEHISPVHLAEALQYRAKSIN